MLWLKILIIIFDIFPTIKILSPRMTFLFLNNWFTKVKVFFLSYLGKKSYTSKLVRPIIHVPEKSSSLLKGISVSWFCCFLFQCLLWFCNILWVRYVFFSRWKVMKFQLCFLVHLYLDSYFCQSKRQSFIFRRANLAFQPPLKSTKHSIKNKYISWKAL